MLIIVKLHLIFETKIISVLHYIKKINKKLLNTSIESSFQPVLIFLALAIFTVYSLSCRSLHTYISTSSAFFKYIS